MRLRYVTNSATGLACVLFFTVSLHALYLAQVDTNPPHERWRRAVEQALNAAKREEVQERKRPAGLEDIDSANPRMATRCLLALGDLRGTSAVPAIVSLIERELYMESACGALARIASPEAVRYLTSAARSPDLETKNAAVYGLREGGRWAVPLLIQLLDDQDLRIKWHKTGRHVWPAQHWAHSALFSCLWRLGFKGENRNLARGGYLNVDEEIAGLKEWWSSHGQDFLEDKSVPTPRISALHASH